MDSLKEKLKASNEARPDGAGMNQGEKSPGPKSPRYLQDGHLNNGNTLEIPLTEFNRYSVKFDVEGDEEELTPPPLTT